MLNGHGIENGKKKKPTQTRTATTIGLISKKTKNFARVNALFAHFFAVFVPRLQGETFLVTRFPAV